MITASIARVGSLSTVVSSASDCSIVGAAFVKKFRVRRLSKIEYLIAVDGTRLHVLGYVDLSVRFKESVVELKGVKVVQESLYPLILGLDWLKASGAGIRFTTEGPRVDLVPRTAVVGSFVTHRSSSSTPAIVTKTDCLKTPRVVTGRPRALVNERKQIPGGKVDKIRIQNCHEGAVSIGRLSREKVKRLLRRLVGSCYTGEKGRQVDVNNFSENENRRILARFSEYIVRLRPIQAPPWPSLG